MMETSKLLVKGSPPPLLDRELTVVGKSLNRRDALEKVTGKAEYSGDIKLPDMLYAKILGCPYPRARIIKIDTNKAEALPGVAAVLTKENTKGWRTYWYKVPQIAFPECITYEGQEVVAVAAEDIHTAQRALDLVDVEYEVLTPMLYKEETLKNPQPPLIADEEYPGSDVFDRKKYVIKRGDIDKGFEEADVIVEDTYTTQASYHGTIQTRACVVSWDGHNLTVWDAIQGVWNSKETLATSLGLDPDNVRVIVKYLGGGFGSKAWSQRITYYAAKLAMMTGRPVRLERTRREEFINHSRRWDCKMVIKMGAKKDGTLTAIYQKALVNIGAAANEENYYCIQIIWHTSNLHACPNVYLEQVGVYTNLQITGPTRSPLNMPAIFALESHMDRVAEALEMDPLAFRLKNYATHCSVGVDAAIFPDAAVSDQETKIPYSSKNLDECMKLATEAIGWNNRKSKSSARRGTKRRGIGMSSYLVFQGVGFRPYTAYADVDINRDGTINLCIGVVDIGGGQQTIFSMIAAEELGVSADDVTVVYGDTQGTRYGPSCHGSRATPELGPAVLQAAAEARQKLFEIAAPLLEAGVQELRSKNGKIYVATDPSKSMPFRAVCNKIDADNPIRGSGSRAPNPDAPMFSTFGAQAVELEVDIETGLVKILKIAAAHDFGKAINPKLCISQIYGGLEFGIGFALSEEGIYDPRSGKLLNTNLHQYRMPTSLDIPDIKAILTEDEDPYFAYSAKGAGENTNAPTPAAIRNAIYDAIGIWFNDLPITPDKIINAINAKKKRR
ncbi:MAG: xanthine dehydrogenase family protein molybdopterin-binding subunit [Desulfobacterales bacterium]|nr:MAG: xanthine dehydrogenase family protein molybdopterin-binding subunit [Desulfobacterales bacterium]